jgi:hypothetical protein
MNDNGDMPTGRTDPFAQGLAAHRDNIARETCPFPAAHVEARRWTAGWDHAAFKAADKADAAGRIDGAAPSRRAKPWSHSEIVVLTTLAGSGEKLGSLASRLGRTREAVRAECDRQDIALTDDQLNS